MTAKLILVFLTGLLISKVTSSYQQPYTLNAYFFREPNLQNPRQLPYMPEHKPFFPSKTIHPAFQKTKEFVAPVIPTSIELRSPPFHISTDFKSLPVTKLQSRQFPFNSPQKSEFLKPLASPKSNDPLSKKYSEQLDTNVLNNLAIALQLLILNNILSNPRQETDECTSDSVLESPCPVESPSTLAGPYKLQNSLDMPNAKFLGCSNFGNDNIMSKAMMGFGSTGTGFPLSRPGFTLMSPYDAIAASESAIRQVTESPLLRLKNDFQSPYAAIMAADNNKDLFSMTDLF